MPNMGFLLFVVEIFTILYKEYKFNHEFPGVKRLHIKLMDCFFFQPDLCALFICVLNTEIQISIC